MNATLLKPEKIFAYIIGMYLHYTTYIKKKIYSLKDKKHQVSVKHREIELVCTILRSFCFSI